MHIINSATPPTSIPHGHIYLGNLHGYLDRPVPLIQSMETFNYSIIMDGIVGELNPDQQQLIKLMYAATTTPSPTAHKAKTGRPKSNPNIQLKTRTVNLDQATVDAAIRLGEGNLSLGIRRALEGK